MPWHRRFYFSFIILSGILIFSPNAFAYRPFVSTDAAVSELNKTEVEIGFLDFSHAERNTIDAPSLRLNYGFAKDWEVVAESDLQVYREGSSRDVELTDSAISLKKVMREGVLQEKQGLSVASEFGVLLPSTIEGQRNAGLEGTQIVSGKWNNFLYHANLGIEFDRENFDPNGLWGFILEYPFERSFRLAGEVNGNFKRNGLPENSALAGFIWTIDNKSFDFGFRKGISSAAPRWELTSGITFLF